MKYSRILLTVVGGAGLLGGCPEHFCAQADVHTYNDGVSSWSFPGRNGFYADVMLSSNAH